MTRHWASGLIGKPWAPGAHGPDAFCCWGLVRWVFELRHGLTLPLVVEDETAALRQVAHAHGWRRVDGPALDGDVIQMRGPLGKRHVGIMVLANGHVGVLHANGTNDVRGARGCVEFQTLAEATADGYGDFELWRCAP
jgi:cell wall-associated NlpC family hydrolase